MGEPAPALVTVEEYLRYEEKSETKHEYYDGYVVAMAGASYAHIQITTRVVLEFALKLRTKGGDCDALGSDMRVYVEAENCYFYPDMTVVCGPPDLNSDTPQALLNPTVIVEVLSPSTRNHDKTYKLSRYQSIPALQEIVFIDSERVIAEIYFRNGDFWAVGQPLFTSVDTLYLKSLGIGIILKDIYAPLLGDGFPDGTPRSLPRA